MSPQADYVVSNGTGAAVRSDINGQLAAIVSNNSGASAPATTYAYMLWADTSTNLLKLRNGANSAWITVGDLTAANLGLATLASPTFTGTATIPTLTVSTAANIPLGSAASPTLYFTGDSNTGLYSPGADQVALSTGGTGRLFIDSSGRCGIGTSSPNTPLEVSAATPSVRVSLASDSTKFGNFYHSAGTTAISSRNGTSNGNIIFQRFDGTTETTSVTIDSSGRVGIGTTAPSYLLHAAGTGAVIVASQGTTDSSFLTNVNGTQGLYVHSTTGLSEINELRNVPLTFNTNATERLRIDTSGRLLVGTSSTSAVCRALFQGHSSDASSGTFVYLTRGDSSPADGSGLGSINFADSSHTTSATISTNRDGGTWSASSKPTRLTFSTTADGASSPTERMRIGSDGKVFAVGVYNATTGVAANVAVDSGGHLQRSTSSIKYKTDVETLEDAYADALLQCRPVWYRSTCSGDNPDWGWWGFIAEEVAAIDPRLVHWKTVEVTYDEKGAAVQTPCEPEPEGVQYERFVPHLLNLIKRQQQAIETLEAKVAALESA